MKLYYFIHLTGRDIGNSGIQRVVRNLGAALQRRPDIELTPVRWCAEREAVVHAEFPFQEHIHLHYGPAFAPSDREGAPIHLDRSEAPGAEGKWFLMAEVPHLKSHDPDYPWVHLSSVLGYLRRHSFKTACIFYDILPLSHFGKAVTEDVEGLKFVAYANSLSLVDAVFPISSASGDELVNWFARNGLARHSERFIQPILLPEEMVGVEQGRYLHASTSKGPMEFCMWGSVLQHKNQVSVLEAFNQLCERRPDLDLCMHLFGVADGLMAQRVAQAARRSRGRIRVHGFIDDRAMAAIIARCRASLFLSLAEGYGLPVAESLWLGLPCVTSNLAPMTEIAAGGGCLLADPANLDDIASAIERLATSDALHGALRNELAERPMRTWADYAAQVAGSLAQRPADGALEMYEPRPVERRPILSRSAVIDIGRLSVHDAYRVVDPPLLRGGVIDYNRAIHGGVAETTLIHGPYIDLGRGRYALRTDGVLQGGLRYRLTFDNGRTILGEWEMKDNLETVEFDIVKDGLKFEILVIKDETTSYVVLKTFFLDLYMT